jgi:hypothetical protein
MSELTNSARKLLRATYTTVPNQNDSRRLGRAFPKRAATANLRVTEAELHQLRESREIDATALSAIETVVHAKSTAISPDDVALFADVDLRWCKQWTKLPEFVSAIGNRPAAFIKRLVTQDDRLLASI